MLTVLNFKLIFMLAIFLLAFGFGLIPIVVKRFKESPILLGIANTFAAGVFIAIALIHIMPEQSKNWECRQWKTEFCDHKTPSEVPVPFILLLCGYTVILALDKIFFDAHSFMEGYDHQDETSEKLIPKDQETHNTQKDDQYKIQKDS